MDLASISDSDLLLALCIAEDGLANPREFAAKLRKLMDCAAPVTVEQVESLDREWEALREEADQAQAWLEKHRAGLSEFASMP
jgi:hypothetical protein